MLHPLSDEYEVGEQSPGKQLDEAARVIVQQIEEEWSAQLGEDRLQQLKNLLRELVAYIETK